MHYYGHPEKAWNRARHRDPGAGPAGVCDSVFRCTGTPLLREIRRERRVEMAIENRRYEDLMRWKAGKLLTVPLRGMKFTTVQDLYDGTHTTKPEIAQQVELDKTVFVDEEDS